MDLRGPPLTLLKTGLPSRFSKEQRTAMEKGNFYGLILKDCGDTVAVLTTYGLKKVKKLCPEEGITAVFGMWIEFWVEDVAKPCAVTKDALQTTKYRDGSVLVYDHVTRAKDGTFISHFLGPVEYMNCMVPAGNTKANVEVLVEIDQFENVTCTILKFHGNVFMINENLPDVLSVKSELRHKELFVPPLKAVQYTEEALFGVKQARAMEQARRDAKMTKPDLRFANISSAHNRDSDYNDVQDVRHQEEQTPSASHSAQPQKQNDPPSNPNQVYTNKNSESRSVLLTNVDMGFGLECAKRYLQNNYHVFIQSAPDVAAGLRRSLGPSIAETLHCVEFSLGNKRQLQRVLREMLQCTGRIDVIVHRADTRNAPLTNCTHFDAKLVKYLMDENVYSTIVLFQCLNGLREMYPEIVDCFTVVIGRLEPLESLLFGDTVKSVEEWLASVVANMEAAGFKNAHLVRRENVDFKVSHGFENIPLMSTYRENLT